MNGTRVKRRLARTAALAATAALVPATAATAQASSTDPIPTSKTTCSFAVVNFGKGDQHVFACMIDNGDGNYTYVDSTGRLFDYEG